MDHFAELQRQYKAKYGDSGTSWEDFSKSHWEGCEWGNSGNLKIELSDDAPVEFISCNACLRRKGYIRVLMCNPRVKGWPDDDRDCPDCDYGLDCETWVRVRGVGEEVERVLQSLFPDAYHPVTWLDAGVVPFKEQGTDTGDLFFDSKEALDTYLADLLQHYPDQNGGIIQ